MCFSCQCVVLTVSSAWSVGQSMDDSDIAQAAAAAVQEAMGEDVHHPQDEEDNFWNSSVPAGEVPLAGHRTGDIARDASSDNLLKEDHAIHKYDADLADCMFVNFVAQDNSHGQFLLQAQHVHREFRR